MSRTKRLTKHWRILVKCSGQPTTDILLSLWVKGAVKCYLWVWVLFPPWVNRTHVRWQEHVWDQGVINGQVSKSWAIRRPPVSCLSMQNLLWEKTRVQIEVANHSTVTKMWSMNTRNHCLFSSLLLEMPWQISKSTCKGCLKRCYFYTFFFLSVKSRR